MFRNPFCANHPLTSHLKVHLKPSNEFQVIVMICLLSQICMDTTDYKGEYYIKCDESLALTNKLNTYLRGKDYSAKIN